MHSFWDIFFLVSVWTSVLFSISISNMFVSSAQSLIPTHHWYSLLKANSSRNHLGPPRDAWIPFILKRQHLLWKCTPSLVPSWARMGLSASLRLFVMAAVGAITKLIYLACCCERTRLWAACKTDSCEGSISIWWFYFSKNKSQETWNEILFSAWIHHMLHAWSLLYINRLILATSLNRKYTSYLLAASRCGVSLLNMEMLSGCLYLFSILSNKIFPVMNIYAWAMENQANKLKKGPRNNSSFKFWMLPSLVY